jgi:CRP-like cAMP-binding protein
MNAPSTPLIHKLSQYAPVSDEDVALLTRATRNVRLFGPREEIIKEGDRPENVHLIIEGWAVRYKLLEDGSRTIMACLIPGDLCDVQIALLDRMDHGIGAISPCKVALIPRKVISDILDRGQSDLARSLWWCTLVDEATLREWLVNIGRRPAEQRIAHFLCEMLVRLKTVELTDGNSFKLVPSQHDLADAMGMTEVHMNRSLRELDAQGLISRQGRLVTISNLERLSAFAGFNANYLHGRVHARAESV